MGRDSDTGFDSEMSSSVDDVVEELEETGTKRKASELEEDFDEKNKKKFRRLGKEDRIKKLHKPPTANELNRLRETENLFHSNLFRLQIEEMLREVRVNEKRKSEFEIWYKKFSDWVLKVEDNENKYRITDQQWLRALDIKVPLSQVPYIVQGTYQFKKPSRLTVIGSHAADLTVGPKFTVDVSIEIPPSFFQKKDYVNCRFHRKRALYMCELLHHIRSSPDLVESVMFVAEDMDELKPKMEIIPYGKPSKFVKVLLHVNAAPETFKLNRFLPGMNNVKRKWYFKDVDKDDQKDSAEQAEVSDGAPTPFYNSTVLVDLTVEANLNFLKTSILPHDNIKDGIMLLKVWLRQRELHDSVGGFNGFLVSMLVCYLLKIRKLNSAMSSYQIFRNVCHYLGGCDWTTNGITLCDVADDANLPTMREFHENHKVVFVDVTGYCNFCYAMSPCLFRNIKHEARLALKWLNDPNVNSFQVLFMTKVPFYQRHDHVLVFDDGDSLENVADVCCSKESRLNYCGVVSPLVRDSIAALLDRGFGERINNLHVKLPEKKRRWKPSKKPRRTLSLILGFNLNPENYFSVVDKASETETESFRRFWGPKSNLRRFQDGTITEALVWSARTLSEKRLVCKEIATYLLKLKFGLGAGDFRYVADQLDLFVAVDVEERSLKVSETFDELSKRLRNLNDMPLDIVSVQGISPVFRYADAFPPTPLRSSSAIPRGERNRMRNHALVSSSLDSSPPWIGPIDVLLQMAASNKWPRDLEAVRRVKAAFNVKISDSLTSQYGMTCKPFQDRIEAVVGGFVFRLKIVHPNEIALLKRTEELDGLVKYQDTEESSAFEKESVFLPKLSSAFHGLYQEHNSFGPACCLVKRWVASHLMDGYYLSEESIELLVASLYLRPEPHEPPVQPQVAFFRFLQLMVTTNWNAECIVLNINNELTRSDVLEIESEFNANRCRLPPVFIATPYDRWKSLWTKDSPTPLILLRLIKLCANALEVVDARIYSKALSETQVLFEPCLETFDVVLTLNNSFNSKKKSLARDSFCQPIDTSVRKIPVNGFDPVSFYLRELREAYADFALFFNDCYGGSVVAVKWKPSVFELCDFKLSSLPARSYDCETKKLEANKQAILEDFWVLGRDLVREIHVRQQNGAMKRFEPFSQ